jgi:hypothetical protein
MSFSRRRFLKGSGAAIVISVPAILWLPASGVAQQTNQQKEFYM